jgi:hypothetical protein
LPFFAIVFLFAVVRDAPVAVCGMGDHSFFEISMKGDATSSTESPPCVRVG